MEFRSYKTVQINEDLAVAVNETEGKIQIMVAPTGMFGRPMEVWLSFEEFQQVVNALQVLTLERSVVKKPKKKKEE